MTIFLGTIKKSADEDDIDFGKEISQDEYQNIINSLVEIGNLDSTRRLFEIVFLNKNDFVDALNRDFVEMAKTSLSLVGDRSPHHKYYLNFNRLFLNYLSSVQTFVDHSKTYIHRKFGSSSTEAEAFKKKSGEYFDNYFSYRFFYKLRNYAVHCVLPLEEFHFVTERNKQGTVDATLSIEFRPETLLKNYNNWGKVEADLLKAEKNILLLPLFDEIKNVLIDFLMFVDSLNATNVCKAAKYVREMTDHLRSENTDICMFFNISEKDDKNKMTFEAKHIPFDIIDDLDLSGCS